MRLKIRVARALKAIAGSVVITVCGIAAFLASIHGPASYHTATRIIFPFMALADLVPALDNYYVYLGCGILSFVLWAVVFYGVATELHED